MIKSRKNFPDQHHAVSEVLEDVYGFRQGDCYQYGPAEFEGGNNFEGKVQTLKKQLDTISPGFSVSFQKERMFSVKVLSSHREKE